MEDLHSPCPDDKSSPEPADNTDGTDTKPPAPPPPPPFLARTLVCDVDVESGRGIEWCDCGCVVTVGGEEEEEILLPCPFVCAAPLPLLPPQ